MAKSKKKDKEKGSKKKGKAGKSAPRPSEAARPPEPPTRLTGGVPVVDVALRSWAFQAPLLRFFGQLDGFPVPDADVSFAVPVWEKVSRVLFEVVARSAYAIGFDEVTVRYATTAKDAEPPLANPEEPLLLWVKRNCPHPDWLERTHFFVYDHSKPGDSARSASAVARGGALLLAYDLTASAD
jgi:hypothetical protein